MNTIQEIREKYPLTRLQCDILGVTCESILDGDWESVGDPVWVPVLPEELFSAWLKRQEPPHQVAATQRAWDLTRYKLEKAVVETDLDFYIKRHLLQALRHRLRVTKKMIYDEP